MGRFGVERVKTEPNKSDFTGKLKLNIPLMNEMELDAHLNMESNLYTDPNSSDFNMLSPNSSSIFLPMIKSKYTLTTESKE